MTFSTQTLSLPAGFLVDGADGAWLDLGADPAAVDAIARTVAECIRAEEASFVIGWGDPDSAVLAHAIAVALGVPRTAAELDLGLITVSPRVPEGSRVVVVSASLSDRHTSEPLVTLVEGSGSIPVATVALGDDGVIVAPVTGR